MLQAIKNGVASVENLLPSGSSCALKKDGLINLSFADVRNGEDAQRIQGDFMSLPGRVPIGAVHVPSQLLGTIPRGTWCFLEELKAKSDMLDQERNFDWFQVP